MSDFLRQVEQERRRHINVKGYKSEDDDKYIDGDLADAAACYAASCPIFKVANSTIFPMRPLFPWIPTFFKKYKHDRKRQLVISASLLMAEYERIVRAEQKATVNLCEDCNLCFATCRASPNFGTGIGNDNVYECDRFQQKQAKKLEQ